MSNQKVWVEVQNGYRLPCPADCEKEIHNRMVACWRENPHERAGFRGLTTYFRNRSFALGTIQPYELAPAQLRGKVTDEHASRAANLIAAAVKEARQNANLNNKQKKPSNTSSSLTSADKSTASSSSSSLIAKRQSKVSPEEFGMGQNYVDFLGKVCVGVCGCVGVCACVRVLVSVCVCVCVCVWVWEGGKTKSRFSDPL
jgi:hypothetical protein